MHQQYKTAGILCARVGLSCSRGREDDKNTCESRNKTQATTLNAAFTVSLVVVESFVAIKACKLTAKQNKQSPYNSCRRRPLPPEV